MAHIKCRYHKVYCGNNLRTLNRNDILCDPDGGDTDICTSASLGYNCMPWNDILCEYAYLEECEFEKSIKWYSFENRPHVPRLELKNAVIEYITYLEIDGRVLIGGRSECVKNGEI